MPHTLILHIQNEDPVVGEAEELPSHNDTLVLLKNPRRLDGKDLHYLQADVVSVYWPLDRINFIEIAVAEEEEAIIGFVRE
ncbi:MAG: hypothetical protein JXA78_11605 [Anaerolineales bacterium]|nr:hypothetical protein [Anaerolineales bacterium]